MLSTYNFFARYYRKRTKWITKTIWKTLGVLMFSLKSLQEVEVNIDFDSMKTVYDNMSIIYLVKAMYMDAMSIHKKLKR